MRITKLDPVQPKPQRVGLLPWAGLLALGLLSALALPAQGAGARLILPDLLLAGFTNDQVRVPVIVNLLPPARALQPTDWNSAPSLRSLHAANHGVADTVLKSLGANEHKLRFRFDNQPGFSCDLTLGGLAKLLSHPQVDTIEPVREMHAHLAQGIPLINALATRSTYDGSGVAIAICDTGIDYNHPRLGGGGFPNSKVIGGYDFGDSDADPIPNTQAHGTCCAGIAAGDLGTVGDYIGGVAPGAKLYACKISYGTTGSAYNDAMSAAWDWCVTHKNDDPAHPIMVISTSFGGGQYFSTCDSSVPAMTTAANNAVAAGITVLASSGNDGFCDSLAWPACISSVISVGAVYDANFGTYLPCISGASCAPTKTATTGCSTGYYATDNTQADQVTSYANVASFLDLFAPGNDCYTTDISGSAGYSTGDYYANFGGTSAACPYAAGAVACFQQAAKARTGSYLTPAQVRSRLAAAGDLITDTKVAITKPRVNLGKTIAGLVAQPVIVLDTSAVTAEGCLPTNGVVDPNETITASFALKNTGALDTTSLVATLLAANGVTLPSAPQTYGALTAGGGAVNRSFSFTAGGTCGGVVTAVLQLQDGTNNLGSVSNAFTLGLLGTPVAGNYSSGGVAVTIPYNTTTEVPIAIGDGGIVADVNVRVRLNHTRDSDLVISLVHPDSTVITLADRRGGTGDNYGSGAADCSGTFTVFDDAAATSITSGSAPFAGTYKPEVPLSTLNGKAVAGTWKLRLFDATASQTGTLYCYQLDVTRQVYACCTGTSADLGVLMTSAPNPVIVGSNLTYSLTVTNLGPATATGITLTDALPTGMVFVSANVSQGTWSTNGGSLFTCALGNLNLNGSAAVSLILRPSSSGNITNTATASASGTPDPNSANNTAAAVTAVNVLPPTVTQPPLAQNVCPGATATFTVTASGAGPLFYQWQTNTINLTNGGHYAGVATSNLTVSGADLTVLGNYRCVVSNQGGSSPSGAAALTMHDTAPPSLTCPPDVTVSVNSGCAATNVILGSPGAGDNCGIASLTNNGLGSYPLGTNVVTWIVSDTSGNTNTCQQRVIVVDNRAPTIICPTNILVSTDTGQCSRSNVTWEVAAGDNCSVASVTSEPPSGSTFPAGVTTVRCTATDTSGNTNGCSFTVTVVAPARIVTQPTNQIVAQGQDAVFAVTATNECGGGLAYQWRWNASDIAGAAGSTYTRTNAQCADAGSIDVVVATLAASQTSSVASLVVVAPLGISSGPNSQTVPLGSDATFCVSVTNECGGPKAYQWRFQGNAIPGATTNCYALSSVRPAHAGGYDVVVTNLASAVTSPAALLFASGPYLTIAATGPSQAGGERTNLALTFASATGLDYIVQYRDALGGPGNWLPLATNPGTGGVITNDLPISIELPGRFYRVLVP